MRTANRCGGRGGNHTIKQSGWITAIQLTIEAVKAYATFGEITGLMREEFGEFREPVGF